MLAVVEHHQQPACPPGRQRGRAAGSAETWRSSRALATVCGSSCGSWRAASSTNHTPSGNVRRTSAAIRSASRVFPTPPTPVRVSIRLLASSRRVSASSRRRPTKLVSSAGRTPRPDGVGFVVAIPDSASAVQPETATGRDEHCQHPWAPTRTLVAVSLRPPWCQVRRWRRRGAPRRSREAMRNWEVGEVPHGPRHRNREARTDVATEPQGSRGATHDRPLTVQPAPRCRPRDLRRGILVRAREARLSQRRRVRARSRTGVSRRSQDAARRLSARRLGRRRGLHVQRASREDARDRQGRPAGAAQPGGVADRPEGGRRTTQ